MAASARPAGETGENRFYLRPRGRKSAAWIDQEMSPGALVLVPHLPGQDGMKFRLRHARTGEHPVALHSRRRGDDENRIAARLAAGLEQERDVKHGHRRQGRESLEKAF